MLLFKPCTVVSGARRARRADGTCVRGVFTALFTAARRPPGPPTHDLKAGLHHLSHREAYGATWSSLGSSLAKSTFGRPAQFGPTLGNWSQVLAYCCSRGLLFTSVVHEAHCCSVVTVNNKNSVQLLTFSSSTHGSAKSGAAWPGRPPHAPGRSTYVPPPPTGQPG